MGRREPDFKKLTELWRLAEAHEAGFQYGLTGKADCENAHFRHFASDKLKAAWRLGVQDGRKYLKDHP